MIIALLLLQAVLCGALLYDEFVRKKAANVATSLFYLLYFVAYIATPLILHVFFGGARSIVNGQPELFDDDEAYFFFSAFSITLLSSALVFGALRKDSAQQAPLTRYPPAYDLSVVFLIAAGLFAFIYSTQLDFADLLAASRFAWTTEDTTLIVIGVLSVYLIGLTPFYIYRYGVGNDRSRLALLACISTLVLYAILTKDRKCIFYLVSGWVAARYDASGGQLNIRLRHIVWASVAFAVVFITNFARDILPRYFLGEDVNLMPDLESWLGDYFQLGDLSYFYRATIEAIHQNLRNDFWVPFALIRRIIFFPIPTSLSAGLKVEDISAIFSDVVRGEDDMRRGSMPPGLFGLFVVSFGTAATIIWMPLFALFIQRLDKLFRQGRGLARDVVLSFYFACLVYAFRGDESTAFYVPAVNYFALLSLLYATRMTLRRASSPT